MRTVYAFQCDIVPKPGQSGEQCVEELILVGGQWVRDAMQRAGIANPPALDWSGNPVEYGPLVTGIAQRERKGKIEFASASWKHPNPADSSLGFDHQLMTTRLGDRIHFAYLMRVFSPVATINPITFTVRPPQLIGKIITGFDCRIGSDKLLSTPRTLRAPDVAAFVRDELLSESRALPVIAVSPDRLSEKPVIDVELLAKSVAGLAQVIVLPDRWATFALTNELGKERSCFWGAVRLYWPGIKQGFELFKNPLFLPPAISRKRELGLPLEEELFRELRNIATFRMADSKIVREARETLELASKEEVDQLRLKIGDGSAKNQELKDYLDKATAEIESGRERIRDMIEEKSSTLAQLEQLAFDKEDLKLQLENKDREIAALKKSFAEVENWKKNPEAETPDPQSAAGTPDCKNVLEAYDKAVADFSEHLVFLDSARRAAEDSPYKNPDAVYDALWAAAEVAEHWRKGDLGMHVKEAFVSRGMPYAANIAPTTRSKYGEEYKFKYKDERVMFEPHITLGGGSPEGCMSIHMYFDEADKKNKKVVIGWCGRHLTNTKS